MGRISGSGAIGAAIGCALRQQGVQSVQRDSTAAATRRSGPNGATVSVALMPWWSDEATHQGRRRSHPQTAGECRRADVPSRLSRLRWLNPRRYSGRADTHRDVADEGGAMRSATCPGTNTSVHRLAVTDRTPRRCPVCRRWVGVTRDGWLRYHVASLRRTPRLRDDSRVTP